MPFRRKSAYGRRTAAARTIQRRWRARRRPVRKMVRRVLRNQEPYKYNMINMNNTIPNRWTLLANLSNIQWINTVSPSYRNSTKIQLKNIALRCSLTYSDNENVVRLAIVRGRRAGELAMSDVSFDPNVTTDDLYLPFNQRYVDVMWSKTYSLQQQAVGATYPPFRIIDINKKMGKILKYEQALDGATSLTVQPYNNTAYFLIGVSDSALPSHPTLAGKIRLSYKDLE